MSSCPVCGDTFDSIRGMKAHCGMTHTNDDNPFKLKCVCQNCDDTFYKVISKVQRGEGKYCSKVCHDSGQKVREVTICLNCGNQIEDTPYEISRGRTYCSKQCQGEHESKQVDRICTNCGDKFSVKKSVVEKDKGKYCSYNCLEESKFYNGNELRKTKKYREWKQSILKRDGYTCQDCGNVENIECHHIVPIYEAEELATDIDNGIALCNNCHADRHRNMGDNVSHLILARVK